MDDLARKVETARQGLRQLRDDAWLDRSVDRFRARRRSLARWRRASVVGIAAVGLLLSVPLVVRLMREPSHVEGTMPVPTRAVPRLAALQIPDGSTATPLDELTVLRMNDSSDVLNVVELVRGGARFSVVHKPGRLFRVQAGPAVIEVLGTEFTVERLGARVRVSVLTGQVQIDCGGVVSQLVEGETAIFPRVQPASDSSGDPNPEPPSSADVQAKANSTGWRTLAAQGNLPEAYRVLQRGGWPEASDPSGLLTAADVARLTHHPAQAVEPLRKLIDGYPKDPRATAAAFTLGRVLDQLGDFRGSAEAFAKARMLDQQATISEDALAREVEAWSRAGDKAHAHDRANEYIRRYPSGRRLSSVRHYGGLE